MSIGTISGSLVGASGQSFALQSSPVPEETETPRQAPAKSDQDTVKLSGAALARSLKQQGHSVAQIAITMSSDAKTIDGYLGISTKPAAVPIPTSAPKASPAAEEIKESANVKGKEAVAGKG